MDANASASSSATFKSASSGPIKPISRKRKQNAQNNSGESDTDTNDKKKGSQLNKITVANKKR